MQVFIQTDYADQSFKNKNWPEISRKTNIERPNYNSLSKCIYLGPRNHIFHHPACFQGPCSNKDRQHSIANFFRIAESLIKASNQRETGNIRLSSKIMLQKYVILTSKNAQGDHCREYEYPKPFPREGKHSKSGQKEMATVRKLV